MAPVTFVEETALAQRTETSGELAPTSAQAGVVAEIQAAIIVARRFPRSEADCYAALLRSCGRTSFAEEASYSFPRGGSSVEGPSVRFAREAARVWGNIRYGLVILRDDDDSRDVEAFAYDCQTNVKVTAGDSFKKLVQRKAKSGGTQWVVPDERDLRELTNRRGAILVRNCILQLLPADFIEDAIEETRATLKAHAVKDPDGERKKVIRAFSDIGVSPAMLEAYLEHPLAQASPAEIADLRRVYASIRDGNSNWTEYEKKEEKAPATVTELKGREIAPRDAKPVEDSAPATEADRKEIALRAQKKGVDADGLEACCQLTCNKTLQALTHADANRVIMQLAKIQQQTNAK